jgi:hypothetical protein
MSDPTPSTLRKRILDLIVARLKTDLPDVLNISKDLRVWTKVAPDAFPVVYVVAGSGGSSDNQGSSHMRTEFIVHVHGYVRGQTDEPDGTSDARELLYGRVLDVLLSPALQQDLIDDALGAHGTIPGATQGVLVDQLGGPECDQGAFPGFGLFMQPIAVPLHYPRGGMSTTA